MTFDQAPDNRFVPTVRQKPIAHHDGKPLIEGAVVQIVELTDEQVERIAQAVVRFWIGAQK